MAYEIPGFVVSFEANADLSAKQYYAVKIVTGGKVDVCSAATDVPIGILQNKPASGRTAEVMLLGISKVSSDAALAVGTAIGPSADGQLEAHVAGTDTTKYVLGIVVQASGAGDEIATAFINGVPHRSA